MLLEASGDVDHIAADNQLATGRGIPAGDDVSGVDADPQADFGAVTSLDALGERIEAVANGKGGSNCSLGVVLVRLRDTEDGEHGVARELLGRPAESLDLRVDQLEELALELPDFLRVDLLSEGSRPRKVGEEDGDDAALLPFVHDLGAAGAFAQREPA